MGLVNPEGDWGRARAPWTDCLPQSHHGRLKRGRRPPALQKVREEEALPTHTPLIPIDETSFEAGIKVQIHSQDEPPFIDQLGFGVAPGFQTFVACQEQRVRGPQEANPKGGAWGLKIEVEWWAINNGKDR